MNGMSGSLPAEGDSGVLRRDANLLTRFDRLPVTRSIVIAIVLLALVWLVESFDIGIVSTLVLVLKPHWNLEPSGTGLLGASATIGLVLAIFPAGRLADRFGRKRVLIAGVTVFWGSSRRPRLSPAIWPLGSCPAFPASAWGRDFPCPNAILPE